MDEIRQIRFLIPPFFLYAALLLGANFDPDISLAPLLGQEPFERILGLVAATTLSVVPLGYMIGTISVVTLRLGFRLFARSNYEASLPDASIKRIWSHLRSSLDQSPDFIFSAIAAFDHELIPSASHEWIVRRWNSFNISIHSSVALVMAHILAGAFSISQDFRWTVSSLIMIALLVSNGLIARRDTMRMIEFQSYRDMKWKSAE